VKGACAETDKERLALFFGPLYGAGKLLSCCCGIFGIVVLVIVLWWLGKDSSGEK
jgi:hypothetical protein